MEPSLASVGSSSQPFTSSIPPKKMGSTLKHAIRFRNDMSSRIDTVRKTQETFKEGLKEPQPDLIREHTQLTKQISIIDSKVNSFLSPIRNLFRGKKQTAELKQVQQDLIKFKQTIELTNEFSISHLKINSDRDWGFLQKNFAHLIHEGPVTSLDFGMSKENPVPRLPFLIGTKPGGGYTITFPPVTPDKSPTVKEINSLSEFRDAYRTNLNEYSRHFSEILTEKFKNSRLSDLKFNYSNNYLEFRYGSFFEPEIVTLPLDRNIDLSTVEKMVEQFIEEKIENIHKSFKESMTFDNKVYYDSLDKVQVGIKSADVNVEGLKLTIYFHSDRNKIIIQDESGITETIPFDGDLKSAIEKLKNNVIENRNEIEKGKEYYQSLPLDSSSKLKIQVEGQEKPVELTIKWSEENETTLEIIYSTDSNRKIFVRPTKENITEGIEKAKSMVVKLRENNKYLNSLNATPVNYDTSKVVYEDGFEIDLKFDNIGKRYVLLSNYSTERRVVYIEEESLETAIKEFEQTHLSVRALIESNRKDYQDLQPTVVNSTTGRAKVEPNLEFNFEWNFRQQKVMIKNPSNNTFIDVALTSPDSLKEGINQLKQKESLIKSNSAFFRSLSPVQDTENKGQLVYRYGLTFHISWNEQNKKYTIANSYQNPFLQTHHDTVRVVSIGDESLEAVIKDIKKEFKPKRELVKQNYAYYKTLNVINTQPVAGETNLDKSGVFKDEETGLEIKIDWNFRDGMVVLSNNIKYNDVSVINLTEPSSFEKGFNRLKDELIKSMELIKDNRNYFNTLQPENDKVKFPDGQELNFKWNLAERSVTIDDNILGVSTKVSLNEIDSIKNAVINIREEKVKLDQFKNVSDNYIKNVLKADANGYFISNGEELKIEWTVNNQILIKPKLGKAIFVKIGYRDQNNDLEARLNDLKEQLSWRKANMGYYNSLAITPLNDGQGESGELKINGIDIRFDWTIDEAKLVIKDKNNKTLAVVSYRDGNNLEEELKVVREKVVLRSKLGSTQLSSEALKTVSPLIAPAKLEKHPNYPKYTDLTSKLRKFASEADFTGQVLDPNAENENLSEASIRKNVKDLADIIDKHHRNQFFKHYGVPDAGPDRDKYFEDLEARLTHVMAALDDKEKENIPLVVIELGVGGKHCGGRWKGVANTFYRAFASPEVDMTTIDLDQWLQIQTDQQKSDTVDHMVASLTSDHPDHVLMRYMNQLKKADILIPGWEIADYSDIFARSGGGLFGEHIVYEFRENMSLSGLVLENKSKLNALLNDPTTPVRNRFGTIVVDHMETGFAKLLKHMPSNHPKKYKNLAEEYKAANALQKGEIFDKFNLTTMDEEDFIMNGVTTRGMLLLMWQTGQISLKEQEMAQLLLSLPA